MLGICLETSATENVLGDVVVNNLWFSWWLFCPVPDLGVSVFFCWISARIGFAHSMQTHAPHLYIASVTRGLFRVVFSGCPRVLSVVPQASVLFCMVAVASLSCSF